MLFKIVANGMDMGSYEGADADAAILAYVQDAGYGNIEDAAKVLDKSVDDFLSEIEAREAEIPEEMVMVAIPKSLRDRLKVACAVRGEKIGATAARLIEEHLTNRCADCGRPSEYDVCLHCFRAREDERNRSRCADCGTPIDRRDGGSVCLHCFRAREADRNR